STRWTCACPRCCGCTNASSTRPARSRPRSHDRGGPCRHDSMFYGFAHSPRGVAMDLLPTEPTSYDIVPYLSKPYPQSQPDRLAAVATLAGLRPVPVVSCRVLELG